MSNTNVDKLLFNKLLIATKRDELKKLSQDRTKLIRKLLKEGYSVVSISDIADISRQRVYKISKKGNK